MANTVSYPFGLRQSASCGKFRKSMLAWLFGISALCWLGESNRLYAQFGPPEGDRGRDRGDRGDRGGRGGFDPSEMIRRMDQDGNGMITANEVERVPSFIRDRWTQQGLDFNRGVRVDDMASNAQRQMEEFRRQREEGGGDRGRDFGRSDRPDFQPPPDMGQNRPATPGTPQSTKPRTRIAPLLPESYKPLDTDYDGQIALFEWRKGKRGTISQFTQQDFDGDGFLTAKELAKAPAPAATPTTAPGTPATATATAAPAPTAPAAPQAPVAVSAEAATKASRAFDILDSDRKGTVEGKEWDQSSRLKPLFQKAGYDLNKPLNKDEFTQAYVRVGADK